MKNLFKTALVLPLLYLSSCSPLITRSFDIYYDTEFKVNHAQKTKLVTPEKLSPVKNEKSLFFEDEFISTEWTISRNAFDLKLKNKTSYTIYILWSQAVFADETFGNRKINSYSNQNSQDNTSSIIPESFFHDHIIPTYTYHENYSETYFPSRIDTLEEDLNEIIFESLSELYKQFVNKPIKILLPIKINGEIKEYLFTFNIKEINIKEID